MSLFFYSRKIDIPETPEHPAGEKTFTDSFNLDKVIRSVQLNDNEVIVLLDDIHERSENVPDVNSKTRQVVGTKRERNVFQTEIHIFDEDAIKFNNLAKA